jgi:hypothetical protein
MLGTLLATTLLINSGISLTATACVTEGGAVKYAHDFVKLTLWALDAPMVALRRKWGLVDSAPAQLVTDQRVCSTVLAALKEAGRIAGSRVAVLRIGTVYVARLPEDLAHDFVFDAELKLRDTFVGLG